MGWWESIVRVTYSLTNRTFYGSGVLVGPQTVLTAAHNVWPNALAGRPINDNISVLSVAGAHRARSYRVHPLWESGRNPSADMAVVFLPAGAGMGLPVRLSSSGAPLAEDAGLFGFPPSAAAGIQSSKAEYQTGVLFQVSAPSGLDSLLSSDFFVKHGFSGGPFLVKSPDGVVYVIGIATYEMETIGRYAPKGLPLLSANFSILLT